MNNQQRLEITFLQGNCLDKIQELDDNSIDCVVSSPPYWGLRDYGVEGQLGLETTYQEHIKNIVEIFRAMKPKLKETATIWLNYGDSYAATVNGTKVKDIKNDDRGFVDKPFSTIQGVLKPKDLVMIPNRIAIALQDDGWWIRSEIIWHKPNPMPESVKDRPTSAHEKIWLITKSKKYYYDADAIRVPQKQDSIARAGRDVWKNNKTDSGNYSIPNVDSAKKLNQKVLDTVAEGKIPMANKRNVWTVTTKPFKGAHFATFPKDLIEPCIKAGCPEKICVECGKPYIRKIKIGNYNKEYQKSCGGNVDGKYTGKSTKNYKGAKAQNPSETKKRILESLREKIDLGLHKNCECNTQDYKPGIVLDPFGGSGTTGIVSKHLKRKAILIELNAEYISIAKKRINKEFGLFK